MFLKNLQVRYIVLLLGTSRVTRGHILAHVWKIVKIFIKIDIQICSSIILLILNVFNFLYNSGFVSMCPILALVKKPSCDVGLF